MGPLGVDLAFRVIWFRFRLLRWYLSGWPTETGRIYLLLEMFSEGCPGHGPVHLLSASAEIGFRWDPLLLLGLGLVCLYLVTWLVRFSIFELLSLMFGVE